MRAYYYRDRKKHFIPARYYREKESQYPLFISINFPRRRRLVRRFQFAFSGH